MKEARLRAALERFPETTPEQVRPPRAADPPFGYRTRLKLVAGAGGTLGLYAREHRVVDIPECRVATPTLARVANRLRALARQEELGPLTSADDGGALLAVDLREVRGGEESPRTLVTWIVDEAHAPSEADLRHAAERLAALEPTVAGVAVARRARDAHTVLGGRPELVWGQALLPDVQGGTRFLAAPGAFVQVHRSQAARLHEVILQELERHLGGLRGRSVLDLHAGEGPIGLALARRGAVVTAVEANPAAGAALRAAVATLPGFHVVVGDVRRVLGGLRPFDVVVTDPPRRGHSADQRRHLARLAREVLVLVSCHPETLARDLAHLGWLGWRTRTVTPLDMMPQTEEVEAVAVLTPGAPARPLLLDHGTDWVALAKPPGVDAEQLGDIPAGHRRVLAPEPDESGIALFIRSGSRVAVTASSWVALARGTLPRGGTVRGAGGARWRVRRLERLAGASLARLEAASPQPGQLERALARLGHPLLNGSGATPSDRHLAERHGLDRAALHLAEVEIRDADGARRVVCPLPGDLTLVLDSLRRISRAPGPGSWDARYDRGP